MGLATLAVQLPFFDRWFSAMDEGHILYFAELIRRGGQLYRDASVYPLPGAFELLALVFQLYRSLQTQGLGSEGNHSLVKALESLAGLEMGE